MKKFICFAVAFLTSVLMFIATGLFIKLNTGLMEPLIPAGLFIIVLHIICAAKFVLLIIMLMPQKPLLKQICIGFILADIGLLLTGNVIHIILSVPVSLVAMQVLILFFYMALQGRLWLYKANTVTTTIENELIASPI
jgi:hypothetical protein